MQGHQGACATPQMNEFNSGMPQVGGPLELKTQFCTREGEYRLLPQCDFARNNRVGYNSQSTTPVKISFIFDKACYNVGRELYLFTYKGVLKAFDPSKHLDRKWFSQVYKGCYPTSHDFNVASSSSSVSSSPSTSTIRASTPIQQDTTDIENGRGSLEELRPKTPTPTSASRSFVNDCVLPKEDNGQELQLLIGFSAGQIQIIDPLAKETTKNRLYNDERIIDRTKVTNLAWVPYSTQLFLVSHTSGQMYLYKSDCISGPQAPHYQVFKTGLGYTIYTCRSKQTRNPLFRWVIGEGSLNNFAFSPGEGKYLATVSQDGVMRCFEYARMDLIGSFRSYFGGLLCVAWSPDAKYVLCGGEDDLVTLWSLNERRVVARGQGHNSWVNCVRFDPYLCCDGGYRFGSVGQDTQLCLWDVNESDMLKQPKPKKYSSLHTVTFNGAVSCARETTVLTSDQNSKSHQNNNTVVAVPNAKHKENSNHKDKEHCNGASGQPVPILLGASQCPRLNQVPMLEPLVCKRIAPERLTALHFREDSIVTACQEGYVFTWARPGVRLEGCERADFGTSVAAAFIDVDVPPATNSMNNSNLTLTASGNTSAATATSTTT